MTGYYIEVGYNSCFNKDEVWEKLKEVVLKICNNPEQIAVEAGGNIPDGFVEAYRPPFEDLTIQIIEREDIYAETEGEVERFIQQYASGGDEQREIKEKLRRAFCRLVMKLMHAEGMEINIYVK